MLDNATNNLLRALKRDMLKKDGRVDRQKLRKDGYSERLLDRLEQAWSSFVLPQPHEFGNRNVEQRGGLFRQGQSVGIGKPKGAPSPTLLRRSRWSTS